ncbi:MAG TPA: cyclodeaminase/cyclohydrolase family protein [Vicinamibacterales bacterium]
MTLTALSVSDLLAAIRSPDPTPGGGSAAALAGAVGASLLAMVAGLPKSRAATEEDVQRLTAAGERCAALSGELETLVERDSEAYDLVMAAYRKPKATDAQRTARSAAIQAAMREAIAAPLDVMRACAAAAEQGVVIATLGNPSASSDLQVGFELLGAALRGARLNVEINLDSVKDADYVARMRGDVEEFARAIGHETAAARRAP